MKNTIAVIIVGIMLLFMSYQSGQIAEWKRLYKTTSAQLDKAAEQLHGMHAGHVSVQLPVWTNSPLRDIPTQLWITDEGVFHSNRVHGVKYLNVKDGTWEEYKSTNVPTDVVSNTVTETNATTYLLDTNNVSYTQHFSVTDTNQTTLLVTVDPKPKDTDSIIWIGTNNVAVIEVLWNGTVLYDTNNVNEATRFFWKTLTDSMPFLKRQIAIDHLSELLETERSKQ